MLVCPVLRATLRNHHPFGRAHMLCFKVAGFVAGTDPPQWIRCLYPAPCLPNPVPPRGSRLRPRWVPCGARPRRGPGPRKRRSVRWRPEVTWSMRQQPPNGSAKAFFFGLERARSADHRLPAGQNEGHRTGKPCRNSRLGRTPRTRNTPCQKRGQPQGAEHAARSCEHERSPEIMECILCSSHSECCTRARAAQNAR